MSLENPWGQVPEPEAEPIEMPSPERVAEQLCARLKEALFPLLAGHDPSIQGAALAELTARWLAGFAPELRKDLFEMHMQATFVLIEPIEMEMFGPEGHPGGRERDQCP